MYAGMSWVDRGTAMSPRPEYVRSNDGVIELNRAVRWIRPHHQVNFRYKARIPRRSSPTEINAGRQHLHGRPGCLLVLLWRA